MQPQENNEKNQYIKESELRKMLQGMQQRGYRFPDKSAFRNKVLAMTGIDLDTSAFNDVRLAVTKDDGPTLWAIRHVGLLIPAEELDYIALSYDQHGQIIDRPLEKWDTAIFQDMISLNRLLIKDDATQLRSVMERFPELGYEVVFYDGYTGNKALTRKMIDEIEDDREGLESFGRAVYGWMPALGKLGVRTEMLERILEVNPDLLVNAGELCRELRIEKVAVVHIAHLLEASLKADITGFVDELCITDRALIKDIREHNYYKLPLLEARIKAFSRNIKNDTPIE
ncbi:hypothetical protein CLV59_109303 [Chitinophaga dinghuensis]|uniref:Uncharacterized protein n=1 Tax=Chitinophaga dinghuensis TaxID=1539050 RepID=A0A327VQE8_9BACT|nr:hypothetical protein [Chitinophaga dinghuensis]RAJ75689.1 hypothetical protein CLV59_109303 [Chitinophaga dinghuensis]